MLNFTLPVARRDMRLPRDVRLPIDSTATFVIAAFAFALSYSKLVELAERAGYSANMSHLWPIIVDGLAVVATRGVMRLDDKRYSWFLLISATAVSVVAAVAQTVFPRGELHPFVAAAVAVVPPLCLLAAPHLAVQLRRASDATQGATLDVTSGNGEVAVAEEVTVTESQKVADAPELSQPTPESRQESTVADTEAAPEQKVAAPRKVADTSQRAGQKARALHLLATTDMSQRAVAAEVGVTETSVRRWVKKAQEQADANLFDVV